jgi:hypothetical protein
MESLQGITEEVLPDGRAIDGIVGALHCTVAIVLAAPRFVNTGERMAPSLLSKPH